jgi:ectoine hydroxylase-related dioxygenase (phytanoyl-CoA dioxygenase family)
MSISVLPQGLDLSFHPVRNPAPRYFTPAQIADYNEAGYVTGIPIFDAAEVAELQAFFAGAKARLTAPGDFHSFHHELAPLYDIVTNPRLVGYLQDLLGPNVVCYVSQYVCKEPGNLSEVVWHQDAAYNPLDTQSVLVWLAVDDADVENGCMRFIPSSHTNGLIDFTSPREHSAGAREVLGAANYGAAVPIELKAGQVVFFSDLLLHSSPGNRSATRRRGGFTMTFTSAETRLHSELSGYQVTNRESVLCAGIDADHNWVHHPRPE